MSGEKTPLRWARRAALAAWLSGIASVALARVEAHWYVFHPHYLPLCTLFVVLPGSTLSAIACCLWRIVLGPRRIQAMLLAAIVVLPASAWATIGIIAQKNWQRRLVPNTFAMNLAKVMGATLMRAEADLKYRKRLETSRLVMFYDRLDHPEQDLKVMDRHLARLEWLLGGKIKAKAYWIRGRLLGVQYSSFHGLALGSEWTWDENLSDLNRGGGRGDRHELAHAALDWFRAPSSDPPYVLHEGWAMAQCGDARVELAQEAANSLVQNPSIGIRELLGPDWYYQDAGPVYSVGGAFVEFLIRTRGAASFRRFYTECQLDSADAQCREILGTGLDDLEAEFWEDVQNTLREFQANE